MLIIKWGCYWLLVTETRNAAVHPTKHRTVSSPQTPTMKNYLAQNVHSTKVEKPCPGEFHIDVTSNLNVFFLLLILVCLSK